MILSSRNQMKEMFDEALKERENKVDQITDSLILAKKKYAKYMLMNIAEKAEIITTDITQTKVSLRELSAQYENLIKQYDASDLRIVS